MIRVVIADSSPMARYLMAELVNADANMLVIGAARHGVEVAALAQRLKPDLILMDADMPRLDSVAAIRRVMERQPTPIVLVAELTGPGAELVLEAMSAGAVEVLPRPDWAALVRSDRLGREQFLQALESMAGVAVVRRRPVRVVRPAAVAEPAVLPAPVAPLPRVARAAELIAVGASTGGPPTVATVLSRLGPTSPPVVLVQHIARGFSSSYAAWLGERIPAAVTVASHGERLLPGHVYVAPENEHLQVTADGRVHHMKTEPVHHHRPSITVLFESVARQVGPAAVGVQLTGMGRDGADGLLAMRRSRAMTLVQSVDTSIIPGMPGAAIELGAATLVASPEELRDILGTLCSAHRV